MYVTIIAIYLNLLMKRVYPAPMATFKKGSLPSYPQDAIDYLKMYNYLTTSDSPTGILQKMDAMRKFQESVGIPKTGTYTKQTKDFMKRPRCGESNFQQQNLNNDNFQKRDSFTYYIDNWSNSSLSKSLQNNTIRLAFYSWRKQFARKLHLHWDGINPDFKIIFVKDSVHLDLLGSPQNLLKIRQNHSSILMYFNANFTKTEYDLYKISKHAFGHSLGLHHDVKHQYMSPFTVKASERPYPFSLKILKQVPCNVTIKSIYNDPSVPASYIMNGDRYWEISSRFVMRQYCERKISPMNQVGIKGSRWSEPFMEDIDEAFVLSVGNWDTFFFKGSLFYRYSNGKWDGQPGKNISEYWSGIPDDVDAAFSMSDFYMNVMYFLKGDNAFKFEISIKKDSTGKVISYGKVSKDYPKLIKNTFPRLPDDIDSAFKTYCEGTVFFFKGNMYWEWNEKTQEADGPFNINALLPGLCM